MKKIVFFNEDDVDMGVTLMMKDHGYERIINAMRQGRLLSRVIGSNHFMPREVTAYVDLEDHGTDVSDYFDKNSPVPFMPASIMAKLPYHYRYMGFHDGPLLQNVTEVDDMIVLYDGDQPPIQPVYLDSDNVIRFLDNRIVRDLLSFASDRGFTLDTMARKKYTAEEHQQFAQLIGYSVSGYGDLSYVDRRACDRADHLAHQLTLEFDLKF